MGGNVVRAGSVLALVVVVSVASGCGGGLKCPPGTVKDGGTCRAVQDVPRIDVIIPDVPQDSGGEDTGLEEGVTGDVSADGASDPGETDIPATQNFPGGVIAKACSKNSECRNETVPDGVCLGWDRSSYCSRLDCQEPGHECPEGALCMGITIRNTACAAACESDADCRSGEMIHCKLLPDLQGELVRICHGVISTPRAMGEPCIGPSDCAGAMSCLTNFEKGYCTLLRCGADEPCPEDAECIRVGGNPVCLKKCAGAGDCTFLEGVTRACVDLKSAITGARVDVCASATSGVGIGEQCLNDTECKSNDCHVTFLGLCPDSATGCTLDSDCELNVCVKSSEHSFGYCTQQCSVTVGCPSPGLCVETVGASGFLEAECVPACGEEYACRTEAGLTCHYGDPLLNPARFACARLAAGAIGTSCASNADCDHGECLKASGATTGRCTKTGCLAEGKCPFPTACEDRGAGYKCLPRCRGDGDCPDGQTCKVGLVTSVCAP